jgi:hypothetical protein
MLFNLLIGRCSLAYGKFETDEFSPLKWKPCGCTKPQILLSERYGGLEIQVYARDASGHLS